MVALGATSYCCLNKNTAFEQITSTCIFLVETHKFWSLPELVMFIWSDGITNTLDLKLDVCLGAVNVTFGKREDAVIKGHWHGRTTTSSWVEDSPLSKNCDYFWSFLFLNLQLVTFNSYASNPWGGKLLEGINQVLVTGSLLLCWRCVEMAIICL